jgi:hypothetical protein
MNTSASTEANAASAAQVLDMELENDSLEYDPNAPLEDFNELYPDEDPIPALKKSTNGKETVNSEDKEMKILAFREKLAQNGYALRSVLMDERIQTHYVSPMSTEMEMSIEEILSEIPNEDLHEVGIVQERIVMPLNFVQKYILATHTQSAKSTIRRKRREPSWWDRNSHAVLNFYQSIIDFGRQNRT